MKESNRLKKTIMWKDYITFIYRWGKITPSSHVSLFGKRGRKEWLKHNTDYGDGVPLTPKNNDKLRDEILKMSEFTF